MRLETHVGLAALALVVACGDTTTSGHEESGGADGAGVATAGEGGGGTAGEGGTGAAGQGGAGGTGSATPQKLPDNLMELAIEFDLRVGGDSVACGNMYGPVGDPGAMVEFTFARFFVHDLMLIDEEGTSVPATLAVDGQFQNADVAVLDFENGEGRCEAGDAAENHVVRVGVEPGTYVGLAFTVGVPESVNHEDPTAAAPPLDDMAMHWGWTQGYKFIRIDARTEGGATNSFHLGSTFCGVDAFTDETFCGLANEPHVMLDAFDPDSQRIVLDYAALIAGTDPASGGCIAGSGAEPCSPMMQSLGVDPETGEADPALQDVFRVEDM